MGLIRRWLFLLCQSRSAQCLAPTPLSLRERGRG